MEVLEIELVKNKKIFLYIIEKEDYKISHVKAKIFEDFLKNYKFDFATIDLLDKSLKQLNNSPIAKFLEDFSIEFIGIDIPEYAKGYLLVEISDKKEQIKELESEYESLSNDPSGKESFKGQNLKSWIDLLKEEVNDKEQYIKLKVKPQWIVKKILDKARTYKKNSLILLHFSPRKLVPELQKLFREFKINVIINDFNTRVSDRTFDVKNKVITSNQILK